MLSRTLRFVRSVAYATYVIAGVLAFPLVFAVHLGADAVSSAATAVW